MKRWRVTVTAPFSRPVLREYEVAAAWQAVLCAFREGLGDNAGFTVVVEEIAS